MKILLNLLVALFMISALPNVSFAYEPWEKEEDIEYGVTRGDLIPNDLSGFDQHGKPVNLSSLTGDNGIVLYFIRSAEWCRFCIEQLREISRKGSILEDTGYNIVVVSHDSQEKLKKFTRQFDFPYPMIADPESQIIKEFGLLNATFVKGTAYHGIAYPALYIVGYDGLILEKYFHIDYKVRPTLSQVRTMLDHLGDYESVLEKEELQKTGYNQ